jgi:RNA polymerase sigma-70 factor (ECF subfamily)
MGGMAVTRPEEPRADGPRYATIEGCFEALESPLLHYALRWLPSVEAAEDVVQEAFMRLHAQFGEVREARSWLYRTVHNLALNQLRRSGKVVPLDAGPPGAGPAGAGGSAGGDGDGATRDLPDPGLLPDQALERLEGIGMVRRGLDQLDARSRELIELKFREDLSYRQISERTGLTVGHVGYLLHHSIKALAAELAKAGLIP